MRDLLLDAYRGFIRDGGPRAAAAIAYHALFAMAPLLLVAVSVAGLVFGEEAAAGEVEAFLAGVVGTDVARLAESLLVAASRPTTTALGATLGVTLVLVGSVRAFAQLQGALNVMWDVAMAPGTPWWRVVLARLVPFSLVVGSAILLTVLIWARSGLEALASSGLVPPEWDVTGNGTTAMMAALAFATICLVYKLLPDVRIEWRDVRVGAAFSTLLLGAVTWLFGEYLSRSGVASVFGAAASLVALLLWVYYSAQIVLLGAELAQVHARRRGEPIRPAAYATLVSRVLDGDADRPEDPEG